MNAAPPKHLKLIWTLVTAAFLTSGCTALEFQPPIDEISELCNSANPVLGNTKISCETLDKKLIPIGPSVVGTMTTITAPGGQAYRKIGSPAPTPPVDIHPGLIVLIEPGTLEANITLMTNPNPALKGSSLGPLVNPLQVPPITVPVQMKPFFRTLVYNFVAAFLKRTFEGPPPIVAPGLAPKYGHVYFVKGDVELRQIFLETLKKATALHSKVDLFLVGNGIPGTFLMTKDLLPVSPGNLTAEDFFAWIKNNMTAGQRNKVRAIFQTHSFVGRRPPNPAGDFDKSFADAFSEGFIYSKFYGSNGANFYPLHRDFVAFETFYKSSSYPAAITAAKKVMRYNQDGSLRKFITYPAVKALGCMYVFGFRKCKFQNLPITVMNTDTNVYNTSKPHPNVGGLLP